MADFIIVIEVDNKRAQAAYQKGLADLELIWPQIEAYATKKDEARNRVYRQELEAYAAAMEQNREIDKKYLAALTGWQKSSWCRGSAPVRPHTQISLMPYRPSSILAHHISIKAELKHMADVAAAALGPFRMTERQVRDMVSWEDGSAIERIKSRVFDDKAHTATHED